MGRINVSVTHDNLTEVFNEIETELCNEMGDANSALEKANSALLDKDREMEELLDTIEKLEERIHFLEKQLANPEVKDLVRQLEKM